jgi:virulence factor Mce-like protein
VLFSLSCVCLILFVWLSLGGSTPLQASGYQIHALFSDASQLSPNADVRIAGVTVGKVVTVQQKGLDTDATIQLRPDYVPLPADAKAILRQKTLLGETFVQLTPGDPKGAKLQDGSTLAASQIVQRQPLDRLLGALDTRTRANLQALFTGTSSALAGRGRDLNASFGELGPTATSLSAIIGILDRQRGSVRGLVRDTASVLNTVADRDSDVQGLVDRGNQVLATTARRDRAVTDTVRALPGLVTQLHSTMRSLDHTSQLATPALQALRPAAKNALPALRGLDTLAPKATKLFNSFHGLIPTARRALPAVAQVVNSVTPFADALYPIAQNIVPVINLVNAHKQELQASMANVAAATQATSPDTGGAPASYLRTLVPFTEEGLIGYTQRLPTNRHNPYAAPGEWAKIGLGGLDASDCRNTSNAPLSPPLGTGAPPCRVQAPWTFDGATRYYPSLGLAKP